MKITVQMLLVVLVASMLGIAQTPVSTLGALYPKPVEMKLLVLAGDGTEASFAAIQVFLNYTGIPYDKVLTARQPIPPLSDGKKGFYQGIILATGSLAYQDKGAFKAGMTAENWIILDAYCKDYRVRLASYYTFPEVRFGMQLADVVTAPTTIQLLPAAAQIFPYLNLENPIKFASAYAYLAKPVAAVGETTTPLMEVNGVTAGVIHT